MLTISMLTPSLMEVKEVMHGFTSTRTNYWYYDVINWRKSSHGRKGELPDRGMVPEDIEWVQTYYLPRVQTVLDPAHTQTGGK